MHSFFEDIERGKKSVADELRKQLTGHDYEADEPYGFRGPGVVYGDMVPPAYRAGEYLKAAVGWVYACVTAIADAVAKASFKLFRIEQDGSVTEITDHAVLDFLSRVNPHQTEFDHRWLSQIYLELTGESPWYIDRGDSGEGEPQNMLLLSPDKLQLKKAQDGSPSPIAGYEYREGNKKLQIEPSEIVFLKYPDPTNMFRGRGTLAAAAATVDIDIFSENFNKRFFYNSARPDSVLSTDFKLTPKQREELTGMVNRLYRGLDNAHKTAILESGIKWAPMSISQKDMDFLEQQKYSMAKILSIFRVPKPIVAISDDVNLANAKIAEYVFAKWTVKPKLLRIAAQLNEFLLPMFEGTEDMFITFEDPVPQDTELDLKRYASGLGQGGAAYMTINEVRKQTGLDDIGPDGDVIYLPLALAPIGTPPQNPSGAAGIAQGKAISVKAKNGRLNSRKAIEMSGGGYQLAQRRISRKKRAAEAMTRQNPVLSSKIDAMALIMARQVVKQQWKQRKANEQQEKEDEMHAAHIAFGNAMVLSAAGFERRFMTIQRGLFKKQEDTVLANMSKKAVKDVTYDPEWLLDPEDESQLAIVAYNPDMKKLVKEQGDRAARLVATDNRFDEATQAVQAYLRGRTYEFSFETTEETNDLLAKSLKDGVKEGESIAQLKSRVQDVFNGMERYRAERIARSEVIRASNFAATEAYKQSGVVDKVQWLTIEDERTCPFCEPLDGKEIATGETFFNEGDTVQGADGSEYHVDYSDVEYPPLHPSCRCTVIPIVAKGIQASTIAMIRAKRQEFNDRQAELDLREQGLKDKASELAAKENDVNVNKEDLAKQIAETAAERQKLADLRHDILTKLNT